MRSLRFSSTALAQASARHPWRTIALWALALVVAAGVIFVVLPGTMTTQYTFLSSPDSQVGRELLRERMDLPPKANEVVIVRSASLTSADPEFRQFVLDLQGRIAALGPGVVDGVASYALGGDAAMVSQDGRTALITLTMAGDLSQAEDTIDEVHDVVHAADGRAGFTALVTGTASIGSDFGETAERDLRRGEGIGVPIALVILLLVFGALVAAMIPIGLALIAITVAVALTALLGQTFDLSVFAINMISAMGLATGIDYSLFIVSRFREERARGRDKIDAIAVTGGTATRAVVFSGLTVVLALLGMLIVPSNVFVSLATGAILAVLASVAAALTLLPAALGLLGDRVDRLRVPFLGRRLLAARSDGRASWIARVAQRAMRRPGLALAVGVGVLLLCAAPALTMKTGVSGVESLPGGFQSRQAFAVLERQFGAGGVNQALVVVDAPAGSAAVTAGVERLTADLSRDPIFGPPEVQTSRAGDLTLVSVPVNGDAQSELAIAKVRELRATYIPQAFAEVAGSVYVTGLSAGNADYIDIVNSYFPWVVALVLALSFVLLLVAFRSVVIPAKAIAMNLLSVGAAYGLITLVSLNGFGADLLGFQQVDVIEQWVPLFLFSVLFGLSMDYQVFLLSRVKEEWDRSGDNAYAVTSGLGSTAGIITGAALIMVAVFAGFASGDLVMFQQMGFGLAVAVLLDATLVRILLVPAAMKLLGSWNWYLPSWLSWLPHVGIEGAPAALRAPAPEDAEAAAATSPHPETPPKEEAA